jgi:cutinase
MAAPVALMIPAAVALIASAPVALIASAPTAHGAPCPDVELIFARGTSEPVGAGRVGQALAGQLAPQLGGRSLGIYGVNYPATYDFLAAADGAADATNRIAAMSQQCPSTRYVLGGYSQGAAVVDMLVGIPPLGDKVGEIGSAPPLPPVPCSAMSKKPRNSACRT